MSNKFTKILASALNNNFIKFIVVLIYATYLGFSIYGVTNSELRLNMSNLVPYDSYVVGERQASDKYFSDYYGYAQAVVYTENARMHEPSSTAQLLDLYEKLSDTEFSSKGEFWLIEFMEYATSRLNDNNRIFSSEIDFIQAVHHFLDEPANLAFKDDVLWSSDLENIRATRMFIRLRHVGGGNHSSTASILRQRFAESRLPGFVTDPIVFLLADQNDAVLGCVLQDAAIATGVIIVIILVFLPKFLCAVWIGLSILSINVGVVGFLALWHVQVDIVSMMTTVMSVGLSVDYVAHVTYQYLITKHTNSYVRLHSALEHAGWSSVQSALATVLGASTLAFVDSYMIRTFVKTVILVVSLGLLHGLLFLPVALSAFVPADQYLETKNYSRVRAYLSATLQVFDVARSPQRRLASYFTNRSVLPEMVNCESVAPQVPIEIVTHRKSINPKPTKKINRNKKKRKGDQSKPKTDRIPAAVPIINEIQIHQTDYSPNSQSSNNSDSSQKTTSSSAVLIPTESQILEINALRLSSSLAWTSIASKRLTTTNVPNWRNSIRNFETNRSIENDCEEIILTCNPDYPSRDSSLINRHPNSSPLYDSPPIFGGDDHPPRPEILCAPERLSNPFSMGIKSDLSKFDQNQKNDRNDCDQPGELVEIVLNKKYTNGHQKTQGMTSSGSSNSNGDYEDQNENRDGQNGLLRTFQPIQNDYHFDKKG